MRIVLAALILALLVSAAFSASAAKNTTSTDLCDLLKEYPAYTSDLRYSDLSSNCSLVADNPEGVGTVILDLNGRSRKLATSLATLDVEVTGSGREAGFITAPASSYPHGIRSTGVYGDLRAEWFTTFIGTDLIACSLRLTNSGTADLTFVPRVTGGLPEFAGVTLISKFDAQDNMMVFQSRETYRPAESEPEQSLTTHIGVMPGFLPKDCLLGDSATTCRREWNQTGSKAAYIMTGSPIVLPAGQSRKLWMMVGVSIEGPGGIADAISAKVAEMNATPNLENISRRRVDKLLGRMYYPPGDPAIKRLYYRSACTLTRNTGGLGGRFGRNHPCFADRTKSVLTPQDASMIAVALAEIDPALAQEQIRILAENIGEDGAMPEAISRNAVSTAPSIQPPLAAWAALKVYQRKKDDKFLKEVYPALCQWTEWWVRDHDRDFDNLCEFVSTSDPRPADQIMDSAHLSAAIAVQMRSLASIARALGRDAQYRSWSARAEAVEQRIVSTLYDPASNLFCDAVLPNHQLQRAVRAQAITPLWAVLPLPRQKEREIVRNYILNPTTFLGEVPFPDVPNTDKAQGADIRVTPMNAYMMIDALRVVRPGGKGAGRSYNNEAKRAAEQYLQMVSRVGGNYEAFDARTGVGLGTTESGVTAAISVCTILGRPDVR